VRIIGLLIGLGGVLLAIRSALVLAGRGRPRRGPRPPFVIAGPYLRLRNPLYAGVVLAVMGFAFWRESAPLLLVAAVTAAVAHWGVVHVEEPALRRRFGAAFEAYLHAVPRWLPRFGRARE
jgi:protein-S-isoprenylcysteine O-methyltransferase Ste14